MNAWDEPASAVRNYVEKEKLPYTILLGGRSLLRDTYNGKSIPHNFVIDKKGRIAFDEVGFSESGMKEIEKLIQELIEE